MQLVFGAEAIANRVPARPHKRPPWVQQKCPGCSYPGCSCSCASPLTNSFTTDAAVPGGSPNSWETSTKKPSPLTKSSSNSSLQNTTGATRQTVPSSSRSTECSRYNRVLASFWEHTSVRRPRSVPGNRNVLLILQSVIFAFHSRNITMQIGELLHWRGGGCKKSPLAANEQV